MLFRSPSMPCRSKDGVNDYKIAIFFRGWPRSGPAHGHFLHTKKPQKKLPVISHPDPNPFCPQPQPTTVFGSPPPSAGVPPSQAGCRHASPERDATLPPSLPGHRQPSRAQRRPPSITRRPRRCPRLADGLCPCCSSSSVVVTCRRRPVMRKLGRQKLVVMGRKGDGASTGGGGGGDRIAAGGFWGWRRTP